MINEIAKDLKDCEPLLTGKTFLITGSNGFLGKVFKQYLLSIGGKVIAVDNQIIGDKSADLTEIVADIGTFTTDEHIDYIINTAGIASPYHYRRLPLETLDVSYIGTRNMLELAKKHKVLGFLAFSSSEVYGDPDEKHIPTPESYNGIIDTMGSRSCYDEGKRIIETLCYVYNTKFGVNTKILRPFNVFGPPLFQNDYRVIPNFISRVLAGQSLNVYGDGKQTRTFCYVTDFIVGAIKVLLNGDNLPYNVGNDKNEISMLDLAYLIKKITKLDINIKLIEYPSVYPKEEPRRRCPDLTKIKFQLGYDPKIDLETGIRRFYDWTKNESV